jgi:hypothetical protein
MPRRGKQNRLLILEHYETIQRELKNENYTFEQKMVLIKEASRQLELLEELQKEKRKRMEAAGKKPGRKKRMYDTSGEPLYNMPKVKKTEDLDAKKKFLSGIQDGQTEA